MVLHHLTLLMKFGKLTVRRVPQLDRCRELLDATDATIESSVGNLPAFADSEDMVESADSTDEVR
jgi:hypothetical protein